LGVLITGKIDGTAVQVSWAPRAAVLVMFVAVVFMMVTLNTSLKGVVDDAKHQKQQADAAAAVLVEQRQQQLEQLKEQNARAEQAKREAAEAARNATIDDAIAELQAGHAETKRHVVNLVRAQKPDVPPVSARREIVSATRVSQYDGLQVSDTSFYDVDAAGKLTLLMVAHLFPGVAYWDYDSKVGFANKDGEPVAFLKTVEATPSLMKQLRGYHYVVGVGLGSNTQHKIPRMAQARARNFCGQLSALVGESEATQVLGMAIGDYTGGQMETKRKPIPEQRPVLIVGIRKNVVQDFTAQEVATAVLDTVGLPKVDLSAYQLFREGASPEWFEISRCGDGRTF
jgi:hypothetical protein